jgi:hypothetical protein
MIFFASGCASFSVEARGGGSTVPEPPPRSDNDHGAPARLKIPPGHFPPPGQCRVWHPGAPPGHQPAPGSCSAVEQHVGPGDWLIYRPTSDKKVVRVSFYDDRSPRVRVAIRVYDSRTGEFLHEL